MGERFVKEGVPEGYYEVPFGEPAIRRSGEDVTILTVGPVLYTALEAAKTLQEQYGVSAEVIDARSIVPFNYEMVAKSVEKTGRIILVSEACERGNILNDMATNISQLCFDYLDAAPFVLGSKNWVTPSAEYDKYFFVEADNIIDAINEKLLPLKGREPRPTYRKAELLRRAKKGV
jgi:2-oxoisovalerate dehydrogenase E1 component